jgi:hypothetical protein
VLEGKCCVVGSTFQRRAAQAVRAARDGGLCALLSGLLLAGVSGLSDRSHAAQGSVRELPEYLLKAGFLFNFAKYVDWPSDAFADPGEPIAIGIVGVDPFGALLEDALGARRIRGRGFRIERFADPAQIERVHILFVPRSERERAGQILERVRELPVLTVGEEPGFAQAGGTVAIVIEAQRPSLQINRAAVARQKLEIASVLLSAAQLIEEGR